MLPAAERFGLGFLPYFPLYNGLLTGKFSRYDAPADSRIMRQRQHLCEDAPWDALEAFQAFCDERGITMLEATFGWLLARPALASVIAGATSPSRCGPTRRPPRPGRRRSRISPTSTRCSPLPEPAPVTGRTGRRFARRRTAGLAVAGAGRSVAVSCVVRHRGGPRARKDSVLGNSWCAT